MMTAPILGSCAALLSAASWALSSILCRRLCDALSPMAMAFSASAVGILYVGISLLFFGMEPMSGRDFLLLGASGLLGIALGDSFFFYALMCLGPRLTVLAELLGPIFTVLGAVIFLNENLAAPAALGILLTLAGVAWVLWENTEHQEARKTRLRGIQFALLSAACMSAGILLAKVAVVKNSALQATFVRLVWGFGALTLWGLAGGKIGSWLRPLSDRRVLKQAMVTSFIVIFGGFGLSLAALKYADASIATALNCTTPLFILPMAAFLLKEKPSWRAILGAATAVVGIVLTVPGLL